MDFLNAGGPGGYTPDFGGLSDRAGPSTSDLTSTADFLRPPVSSPPRTYDLCKLIIDVVVASVLIVLTLPLLVVAWIAVRLTSPGAGIYTQTRVGRGGRHFRIYKIRTMTENCEAMTGGAKWSTPGDSRVTPLGRIFRKLHIDEIPQLWNVVLGDMSLVGPRPERPEFVKPLSVAIPEYHLRLAVRPGVTGLAQIQLPPDSDVDSVRKKVALDRCYIDARGLWLDLRLALGTAIYLVGFSYATVRRVLALPKPGTPPAVAQSRNADIFSYTEANSSSNARDGYDPSFAATSMSS